MPGLDTRIPAFKKRPDLNAEWNTFRKGLNLLLKPTELGRDELAQADNIMLIGGGVPTGRWGTATYFTVNSTGAINGFATYNNTASLTNELIALSDQGYLAKKNGSSSTVISGQSYPSGSIVRAEQLGGNTYFVSKDVPLTSYNGQSLAVFATISAPTGGTATNFSGASGSFTWSWKVTTLGSNGGETTPLGPITLPNLPQNLALTRVDVRWTAPSAATISGYQIYRGLPGDETFLAAVGASTTLYNDFGDQASETIFPPLANTTGGVKSQFITKYNDRLLMVDSAYPTKLLISGRYPNQSRFNWADGGGYVFIDPDSGQDITGISIQQGSDKIVVFKGFSSYAVSLNTVQLGNFVVLDPTYQPVSTSIGCSNPDTIQIVENDIFYFGRKGLYVVGYEPNFLSIIRTNEISARIRPYIQLLNDSDFTTCCSMYINNKYLLSFPGRKELMMYDRERGCFGGLWKLPFGITKMKKYVDGTGTEKWVIGTTTNQVYTFETSINSDNGTTITKTLRTNKDALGVWNELKILKLFFCLLRNITGSVTVNLLMEDRTGATTTIKTFVITGASVSGKSGWGANLWGAKQWGKTQGMPVSGTDEFPRFSQLYKQGRLIQIEVTSNASASQFELLNIKFTATRQGDNSLSSSLRV
jgi:hypothetical protein